MTPPHQLGPFLVSKYAIPAVVFVQYWAQLRYPSPRNLALRKALLALYGAAAIAMAFQSACTDVIRARWPRAHDTLRWGGYDGAAAPILVVAALTAGNFAVCVEREHPRILAALVLPFVGVITFLWSTEGTLALGSKWCTGQDKGDSTSLQSECSARARSGKSIHASRPFREMIARPKISRNEWKTAEL